MNNSAMSLMSLVITLVLFCSGVIARAAAPVDLTVPITSPWFNTGVELQAGERIEISASGLVFWGSGSPSINANGVGSGWDGTQKHPVTVLPDAIWLSLIGKIGGTLDIGTGLALPENLSGKGAGFVGNSYVGVVPISGTLFLGFNDTVGNFGDNSGTFQASLTVIPEPSPLFLLVVAVSFVVLCPRARIPRIL